MSCGRCTLCASRRAGIKTRGSCFAFNLNGSGYVYSLYVPLVVTPIIPYEDFKVDDSKVHIRYAKSLIRSDYYGTVPVIDLSEKKESEV